MKYSLAIVCNRITQHQLSQQSVLGVKGCASKVAMSHSVERPNPVRGDFQTQNQVKPQSWENRVKFKTPFF